MQEILARPRRISRMGILGEELAACALSENGFHSISNLNREYRMNFPFADILAERRGVRYFVSVKARNEERDSGGLNEAYNLVCVADAVNRRLKSMDKSVDDITRMALDRIFALSREFGATPAFVAIPVRPLQGTYCAYFGLLEHLGVRRSIPMKEEQRNKYECLVQWRADPRIEPALLNRAA